MSIYDQGFPKVRCQALLHPRKGSDQSKYPILGYPTSPGQVPGTLQTEKGNALFATLCVQVQKHGQDKNDTFDHLLVIGRNL
jgi:hypothetical protein